MTLSSLAHCCALVALVLSASTASSAGDADVAEDFSYCTTCHGASGNGNPAIRAPKIAGMEPWYLKRQLEAFRDATRGAHAEDIAGQEMQPVGLRLDNEAKIAAAVRYVQGFEAKAPAQTVIGDATRGKTLYQACSACHGVRGEGNEQLGAPALASRSDWYLATQLRNYRSGVRGSDPRDTYGAQMRAAIAVLPDAAAIDDVIAYISTLH